jgi:5-formyltetrahydrofolate cyclo-ligase
MEDFDPEAMDVLRYRAKAALRQRMRALRSTIPGDAIAERSQRIRASLTAHPAMVRAQKVALFWPIERKNEVDLRPLARDLRAKGVVVAFPSIDPETRVMTFRIPADPEAMEERGLGFQEPSPEEPEASSLDVVVVPALGLDEHGNRLGYGAGFYDRTLPRFCPPATTIGVAFDFQVLVEVPVTEGDVALSAVVTDERVFAIGTGDPARGPA